MDEPRNIRFLIPPFFFFLSCVAAGYFSGIDFAARLKPLEAEQILAIAAAIGAATLPIGYLLTSISILLLHVLARFFEARTYEAHLSDDAFERVWKAVHAGPTSNRRSELYAVVTYDHALLPAEIHSWIQRRWNSFNIAAHSCTAILLSQAIVLLPGVHFTAYWGFMSVGLFALLSVNAYAAWCHVMRMLEFQVMRATHADSGAQQGAPADGPRPAGSARG
jgi:hypothetical protein